MTTRRRVVAAATAMAAVAAVGAGGLVNPAAGATAPLTTAHRTASNSVTSGVQDVDWGPCNDDALDFFGAQCGFITAPMDYDHPRRGTVKIAVSRVKHTSPDADYQGIMLTNPGGPGGSGLFWAILGPALVPDGGWETYDWIGFDPRGVGSSVPALSCDPDFAAGPRPVYEPFRRSVEKAWLTDVKQYAKDCGAAGGRLLDNLTTEDSARDMDTIRAALGEKKLSLYGFSYGTYLGQVYASLFPQRVYRMVLDSNVDPHRVWYRGNLDQDIAFEKVIGLFFGWIAEHDDVYGLGSTRREVERHWYAERARLARHPAGTVGASEWTDIFLSAGYAEFLWPDLANLWVQWAKTGDPQPLEDEYASSAGVGDDNGYAMYLGVQCSEGRWPDEWSTWRRDNWKVYQRAPFITWGNAWFNAPCAFWPADSHRPVEIDGSKVPPILLAGETLDGATPFSGSVAVRKLFPRSRLIATPGGATHANTLAGNACVDDVIVAYLADGTLPRRDRHAKWDVTCDALPKPVPTEASAAASGSGTSRGALRADLRRAAMLRG